jgi:hypothetical protein
VMNNRRKIFSHHRWGSWQRSAHESSVPDRAGRGSRSSKW